MKSESTHEPAQGLRVCWLDFLTGVPLALAPTAQCLLLNAHDVDPKTCQERIGEIHQMR